MRGRQRAAALVVALATALVCVHSSAVSAGWQGWFEDLLDSASPAQEFRSGSLSQQEIIAGLKAALDKGVAAAVGRLGRPDGFLADARVRIPIPDSLQRLAGTLRRLGQHSVVDGFQETLNRAAEAAMPEVGDRLKQAIGQMTVEDAWGILKGPDDAATKYLRRTSGERLQQKILPVVRRTTDRAGVTAAYKRLTDSLPFLTELAPSAVPDLDEYVAARALDGLFTVVADEEGRIRRDPSARTTEILRKVFGTGILSE